MRHPKTTLGSWKVLLATVAVAGSLAWFAAAPNARADDCQERVVHADHKLHEAIQQHGYDSKQAAHWRQELHEAREYCWDHDHRWWDVEGNRWHSDRDWDDHDHDHR
jgi:hypothetical protein